jgi:hypothetical protein
MREGKRGCFVTQEIFYKILDIYYWWFVSFSMGGVAKVPDMEKVLFWRNSRISSPSVFVVSSNYN